MAANAVTHDVLLYVLKWGNVDFATSGDVPAGFSQVALNDGATPVLEPDRHNGVTTGNFVALTAPQRAAADADYEANFGVTVGNLTQFSTPEGATTDSGEAAGNFLKRDGTLPMTGDLDVDFNEIIGAIELGGTLTKVDAGLFRYLDEIGSVGFFGDPLSPPLIVEGATDFDVAAGIGMFRVGATVTSDLAIGNWPAAASNAIPLNSIRYVGVEWNAGTPQVIVKTTDVWTLIQEWPVGVVTRDTDGVHAVIAPPRLSNFPSLIDQRIEETEPFKRSNGLRLQSTGLTIQRTAGRGWFVTTPSDFDLFDSTQPGPPGDTFERYFRDSGSGFNVEINETEFEDLSFDDGSGTLAVMNPNRFGVRWFYMDFASGELAMMYGTSNANDVSVAALEQPPTSLPPRIEATMFLLGRVIFERSAGDDIVTEDIWGTDFSAGGGGDGDVTGPTGGTVADQVAVFANTSGKAIAGATGPLLSANVAVRDGTRTFSKAIVSDAAPQVDVRQTGATANEGNWSIRAISDELRFTAVDDALTGLIDALTISRTAGSPAVITALVNLVANSRATVQHAVDDTVPVLTLANTGTNGATIDVHIGDRPPEGLVTGTPGALYVRGDGVDSAVYQLDAAISANTPWNELGTGAGGGISGNKWNFDGASQADTDPGSGNFRLDNATQASATFAFVSDFAANGANVSSILLGAQPNDQIYIEQSSDSARFHLFTVTGDPVDATGYVKLPILSVDAGTDLQDTEECSIVKDEGPSSVGVTEIQTGLLSTSAAVPIGGTPTTVAMDFSAVTFDPAVFSFTVSDTDITVLVSGRYRVYLEASVMSTSAGLSTILGEIWDGGAPILEAQAQTDVENSTVLHNGLTVERYADLTGGAVIGPRFTQTSGAGSASVDPGGMRISITAIAGSIPGATAKKTDFGVAITAPHAIDTNSGSPWKEDGAGQVTELELTALLNTEAASGSFTVEFFFGPDAGPYTSLGSVSILQGTLSATLTLGSPVAYPAGTTFKVDRTAIGAFPAGTATEKTRITATFRVSRD